MSKTLIFWRAGIKEKPLFSGAYKICIVANQESVSNRNSDMVHHESQQIVANQESVSNRNLKCAMQADTIL